MGMAERVKKLALKKWRALLLAGVMLCAVAPVSAESFTHQDTTAGQKLVLAMPDVYKAQQVIDARSLGLEESYGAINDIVCDEDGTLYILSEDGIILSCTSDFTAAVPYVIRDADGTEVDFAGAKGLYVSKGEVLVADTPNNRVLCSKDGLLTQTITVPESGLIPSDFMFLPTRIQRDSKGYLYVISTGSYYGAVMYDPAGEFLGFYGANTVKASALSTLAYFWDTLTQNDIKRAKSVKTLPYQFVDICVDEKDFVYTCTGKTSDSNESGQLRMLSPGGTNILYKKQYNGVQTGAASFTFGELDIAKRLDTSIRQDFSCVAVDDRGFIYALDITYGLVYVYDRECNLLTAFGGGRGFGTQLGLFDSPISLEVYGEQVLVANAKDGSVTVFSLTDFGRQLLQAQKSTLDANYAASKPIWQDVLKQDSHNQLALRGLAKAYYVAGDCQQALEYARQGGEYAVYGQALGELQKVFVTQNFTWLFLGGLLIVGVAIIGILYVKKHQLVLVKNPRVRLLFAGCIHPFDTFTRIRYKNEGSLIIAIVMTVAFYLSSLLFSLCSDFRFSDFSTGSFNSIFQLLRTSGLVLLFSVANWAISVLMHGIGKLQHVFIVTAYSTLPMIIYNIVAIPLSYLITDPSSSLLGGLELVAMFLTGITLCIGMMMVHDFSFPRFLGSSLVACLFMFLIIFVIFVFCILVSQLAGFIVTLLMEGIYR